ncbi:MAG TPA: 50S ribosome-binding GTPase, partial [Candidatus Hydrogenedentes bacterium]|nr:50S ribosome-binding GTPase [Candidatus Hydrogenedentota bacterium]
MTRSAEKKMPVIAICGRPNVGKSTLFNRITGKQRAIVHDEEGITRDRFYGTASWFGRQFRVVDTGGIMENPVDEISRKMQEQVMAALREADAILFVVDGRAEITRTDN